MNHSKLNEILSHHMIYDIPKIFSVFHHSMLKKGFLVKQDAGSDDDKVKTFQQYLFLIKNKHSF